MHKKICGKFNPKEYVEYDLALFVITRVGCFSKSKCGSSSFLFLKIFYNMLRLVARQAMTCRSIVNDKRARINFNFFLKTTNISTKSYHSKTKG